MIYINNTPIYDMPGSCGTCPFFTSGSSQWVHPDGGLCFLFRDMHKGWALPRRCERLFKKAFTYPDGAKLVIVAKEP